MRSIERLRSVAIFSNLAFIGSASKANLTPVLILHTIRLATNVFRLAQLRAEQRRQADPLPTVAASIEHETKITSALGNISCK